MLKRIAHAKINLALHVIGQRDDGYHLLDSLVVFSEYGDVVSLEPGKPDGPVLSLELSGLFASGLDPQVENLVLTAAKKLQSVIGCDVAPAIIHLEKKLPVASGIGGGSADAAAALHLLQDYWKSDVDLLPIAQELGADVPMCLLSKPLRAQGIGDKITKLGQERSFSMLLVNSGVAIATPEIFHLLDNKNQKPISADDLKKMPMPSELFELRNDLQAPAVSLRPIIAETLHALEETHPQLARMSGSGATCFALYKTHDAAVAAQEAIRMANPGWWCVATNSVAA